MTTLSVRWLLRLRAASAHFTFAISDGVPLDVVDAVAQMLQRGDSLMDLDPIRVFYRNA